MGAEHGGGCRPKSISFLDANPDVERQLDLAADLNLTLQGFEDLPEDERALWQARQTRRDLRCPSCGRPLAECSNPAVPVFPQRTVCHVSMELAAANARYDDLHTKEIHADENGEVRTFHDGTFTNWAAERSLSHPYHYRDGVSIWVAAEDFSPDDDFLEVPRGDSP